MGKQSSSTHRAVNGPILGICDHGLRVAYDGSEKCGTQGAFGWALSDDRRERVLATGIGPARGATASAFQAEAFGMLAVTRFLVRLGEFTGHFNNWNGIMATDSQSVLDTIQQCTLMPPGQGIKQKYYVHIRATGRLSM
ncbi:hypothetical protein MHU86_18627 [Fragilaria crotonensis]|nr:hypothetical protein MHU86_18627 [Fragilaria crotonensis]